MAKNDSNKILRDNDALIIHSGIKIRNISQHIFFSNFFF